MVICTACATHRRAPAFPVAQVFVFDARGYGCLRVPSSLSGPVHSAALGQGLCAESASPVSRTRVARPGVRSEGSASTS